MECVIGWCMPESYKEGSCMGLLMSFLGFFIFLDYLWQENHFLFNPFVSSPLGILGWVGDIRWRGVSMCVFDDKGNILGLLCWVGFSWFLKEKDCIIWDLSKFTWDLHYLLHYLGPFVFHEWMDYILASIIACLIRYNINLGCPDQGYLIGLKGQNGIIWFGLFRLLRRRATYVAMRHFKEAIKEFQLLCKTMINMENVVYVNTSKVGLSATVASLLLVLLNNRGVYFFIAV
ncbi:hypothetical protein L1987_64084 [Smallanthus sonchifolius]|uniref:Uncharacterized protein n=1 Tax=Smallanthus sonchifolius TaxID=185202 RepID=A0ACB9CFD7_9ASTR|nr:hypothetical protein L1987_64084 [Smallanthus sonchifolius]